MIVELKKAFNELLANLDWMDEETKKVAREKVGYSNSFRKNLFPKGSKNAPVTSHIFQGT